MSPSDASDPVGAPLSSESPTAEPSAASESAAVLPPAPLPLRLAAAAADAVLVVALSLVFLLLSGTPLLQLGQRSSSYAAAMLLAALLVVTLPSLLWSVTLGKRSMKLALVRVPGPLGALRVVFKYVLLALLVFLPGGEFLVLFLLLTALLIPSRRTALDFLAGSKTVHRP